MISCRPRICPGVNFTEARRMSSLSRDQMKGGVGDIRSAEERADSSSGCRDSSASSLAFWALHLL